MSDMILRRMPKLPLGRRGRDQGLPVLTELNKAHDKIRPDLQYC